MLRKPGYTVSLKDNGFGRSVVVDGTGRPRVALRLIPGTGQVDRRSSERVHTVAEDDRGLLSRVLDGDVSSVNQLVNRLTPIVQSRAERKLLSSSSNRDVRQDVKDYTQDVFLHLFDRQGQILKDWQPERGMSLDNYVGLVAERRVISLLRSGKRNPWRETEALENVDEPTGREDLESSAVRSDRLSRLLTRLRGSLSPLGWQLFELLYIKEQSVSEVQQQVNLSADAVYAWRSRLRKAAKNCQRELDEPSPLVNINGSKHE